MIDTDKRISNKYIQLSDIEHTLKRPGTYLGSTKKLDILEWIQNENNQFEYKDISFVPGFLKIFDEIIINSIDESKRNSNLNKIFVNIDIENNEISIMDNGGIPVVQHSEYKMYIPELIFSSLRAGSNFDDTEDREGSGQNGVGSTLTNIFSSRFEVNTGDGKKEFNQVYSNNLSIRTSPIIKKSNKTYTKISYIPDFKQFGMRGIDKTHYDKIKKRVLEISACNPTLKVYFNDKLIKINTFRDFMNLFNKDNFYESNDRWDIGICYSNNGFQQISYVNSSETKEGGTHTNYVLNQITDKLRILLKKKHKIDVKPSDIKNHLILFVNCNIINPTFTSQTKEKLTTEIKDFGSTFEVSDKLIKSIFESDIIKSILDWIEAKKKVEENSKIKKLNKDIGKAKIVKLIDASEKNNRKKCTLCLFEGLSAISSFRIYRDPKYFGGYPLKGKVLNITDINITEIIKNEEIKDMLGAIGLNFNKKVDESTLRYGKIYIYTDADYDGYAITGLLINFLNRFWPELFEQKRVYQVLTPIVVAKNKKETKVFYTVEEFKEWEDKTKTNNWEIEYKKGLASLEGEEYKEIIKNPNLINIVNDENYLNSLNIWFSDKFIDQRKDKLKN